MKLSGPYINYFVLSKTLALTLGQGTGEGRVGRFQESFLGSVVVLAYVTDRSDDRARITSLRYAEY